MNRDTEGKETDAHLSNSHSTPSEFVPDNQLPAFRISDPFHFSADLCSEAQIKRDVEDLNYNIDRTLHSIVHTITHVRKPKFTTLICDRLLAKGIETFIERPSQQLYQLLVDFPVTPNTKMADKDLVLQAMLQDQVCRFLHRLFFAGETFAGVDPNVGEILESLYKGVRDEGRFFSVLLFLRAAHSFCYFTVPHSVAQRWRALTISAAFLQMNEMLVNEKAEALMSTIQTVISIAYPNRKQNFNKMIHVEIHKEEDSVRGLIEKAHKLSLHMQRDMVSTLVKVKIAPEDEYGDYRTFDPSNATSAWSSMGPRENDSVLGTYSFGVEQTTEKGHKWILKPELITGSLLRHFGLIIPDSEKMADFQDVTFSDEVTE